MSNNAVIYMTSEGYEATLQKLAVKQAEHKKTFEARKQAVQEATTSDLNDPEIVQLQQLEQGLNTTIDELNSLIKRTQVISINDEMRSTSEVRIGSIVKIERYNITADRSYPDEIWEITGYDETSIKNKKLCYNSPLANVLMGGKAGEVVEGYKIGDQEFDITIKQLYKNWTQAK